MAEPIAIIGMGCRLPGADSLDAFWRALMEGHDAIREIPADRFSVDALYDARPAMPGRINTRWGGFVDGIDRFDAAFFGVSPREAAWLDPQQRLLLETTWEALETAGQVKARLRGTDTGVFVGLWLNEYENRMFRDPSRIEFYMTTGTGRYSASGRLSYFFGWHGPSVTIDCACSSSLVAVHLACQSLRSGECELAVAGGANVLLEPSITLAYSQSRMMAPDGRCKFGDARADGYVRSDGAGVVVLKRLSRALAAGDPVRGLILGSAVNNDGGSGGSFGTPGRGGQEDLLRKACRDAGVVPADLDYVEAHGTGTRAGDPVEIGALAAVFGEGRADGSPLLVGSVKTNIGHTEGAAGVAGLIKVALALGRGVIPPSLHRERPNPDIAWDELRVDIPSGPVPWPERGRPGVAGVSSFGIAGTNAHVIVGGADVPRAAGVGALSNVDARAGERPELIALSAHSTDALREMAGRWRQWLMGSEALPDLVDVASVLALRRERQPSRLAMVAGTHAGLAEHLEAFERGDVRAGMAFGTAPDGDAPGVVLVCSGQGSQRSAMGLAAMAGAPSMAGALRDCDEAIGSVAGWSLLAVLRGDARSDWLEDIAVIQPAIFALQVSLAAQWRSWGIEPAAVVGHSLGEVAAANIAGALDLESAARIICRRSELMARFRGRGAMAVVELDAEGAEEAIREHRDRVSVAVINSPRSTVLSGEPAALDEILRRLGEREVFCRRVQVDVASHSPQMEPIRGELVDSLAGLRAGPTRIPMVSTVTADVIAGESLGAAYWGRNLREPVRFGAAVHRLCGLGTTSFIELSAHPVLVTAIRQQLETSAPGGRVWPSLRRDEDEPSTMLETLGGLWTTGREPAWETLVRSRRSLVDLPPYPWQRERYWYEGASVRVTSAAEPGRVEEAVDTTATDEGTPAAYHIEWRPLQPPVGEVVADAAGWWLVLADSAGVGKGLAARLKGGGGRVVIAERGERFEPVTVDRFRLRPGEAGDLEQLLAAAGAGTAPAWRGVVHCFSLDLPEAREAAGDLAQALAWGPESLLPIVRWLGRGVTAEVPRVWIVTAGCQAVADDDRVPRPEAALCWGFGRVLGSEHPRLTCTNVDLPDRVGEADVERLAALVAGGGGENQVALRGGLGYVPRLAPHRLPGSAGVTPQRDRVRSGGHRFRAVVRVSGSSYGVTLERAEEAVLLDHQVEVAVAASGLNFLNALSARGACPGFERGVGPLGGDCAGRVSRVGAGVTRWKVGDCVFGVGFDSLASHVVTDERWLSGKPGSVAFAAAATMPIAFVTACYALRHVARLQAGERVLIHAAAGGVGQAAMQMARLAGAQVLATAGSESKRAWLVEQGATWVGDSRSAGFGEEVVAATGGRGVDVVLNCLAGPAVVAGLGALAPGGRFVELGKRDIHEGGTLPLAAFRKGISFAAVDLHQMAAAEPERLGTLMGEVGELLGAGQIRPLPLERFPVDGLEAALSKMAASQHIGKLVVEVGEEARIEPGPFVDGRLVPGTYLVTGGAGALGLLVARWLADRGASALMLVNRRPPSAEAEAAIEALRRDGVDVRTRQADVADRVAVASLLAEIEQIGPPLVGVVHAAGVVDNCMVVDLDKDRFWRVTAPKVLGAWNLHGLTSNRGLSLFLTYSSFAPLLGLGGHANYAAANSFLDSLMSHRRRSGLCGTSIAWGPWSEVGMAAALLRDSSWLVDRGFASLGLGDAVARLDRAVAESPPYVAVFDADWARFRGTRTDAAGWPIFADVVNAGPGDGDTESAGGLRRVALQQEPGLPRRLFLEEQLQRLVGLVLRQAPSRIALDQPFRRLGLDSLMGLELRNHLERGLGVAIPATLIWNFPTVTALAEAIARRAEIPLDVVEVAVAERSGPSRSAAAKHDEAEAEASAEELAELLGELEGMSDEEARRALAQDTHQWREE